MTMPTKGTKGITIDDTKYRYKVNKKSENGQDITKIVIENSESAEIIKKETNFLLDVTPSIVEKIIREHYGI